MAFQPINFIKKLTSLGPSTFNEMQARIKAELDNHDTQLADKAKQISNNNSNIAKALLAKPLNYVDTKHITILSDSIGQGVGASAINKSYISLLFSAINAVTNKGVGTGYELNANFQAIPEGFTYGGTYTYGINGPVKKSIILQPGATITFTRAVDYIELYFHKTLTSGKIEFRKNGTLYRTVDCAGTEDLNANTLSAMLQTSSSSSDTYTLTCINASVELTGVMCWRKQASGCGIIYNNRFAVSGTSTGDYVGAATLESILQVGTFSNRHTTVFILDLGTNDIYNPSKATSSANYKNNLRTIATYLKNGGHKVVLKVPLRPTGDWIEIVEPFENYKKADYDLASELNLPIFDLSELNFDSTMYADDLHPNDAGHEYLANAWINFLGIPKAISLPDKPDLSGVATKNQLVINVSSFTANGSNMKVNFTIPTGKTITGVYIKNTTNGLIVPYQDYTDYSNNIGLSVQTDYPSVGGTLYYVTAGGFCKTGRGPLGSLVTNTAANAQIIIEYV